MKRREFLSTTVVGAPLGALAVATLAFGSEPSNPLPTPATEGKAGEMKYRTLGKTGERVSLLGLGGYHIGVPQDEAEAIKIMHAAIDAGVNFMDNCWGYHNGKSEIRMGNALEDGRRDKVFLMSKIDGRTKAAAQQQLEQSLQRLQTDRIDLMQHHEVIRFDDADRIFAEGGAMEALTEAKAAGKIRYIGFTGHKDPLIHLRMLDLARERGFRFDAVQMPINILDAHFRSFQEQVVPVLVKEQIGVLGMKSTAGGHALSTKTATPQECLQFAMTLPTSTVISGMDSMNLFKQNLEVVYRFTPLTRDQIAALLERTAAPAVTGRYEPFKTTAQYDATTFNPNWLG